jgi:hypothetical protein
MLDYWLSSPDITCKVNQFQTKSSRVSTIELSGSQQSIAVIDLKSCILVGWTGEVLSCNALTKIFTWCHYWSLLAWQSPNELVLYRNWIYFFKILTILFSSADVTYQGQIGFSQAFWFIYYWVIKCNNQFAVLISLKLAHIGSCRLIKIAPPLHTTIA